MKRFVILCALGMLTASSLQAQLKDRLMPHMGYIYSVMNLEGLSEVEQGSASYSFNTIGLGAYYMIKHHNDITSFGIEGNANVGLRFSQSNRVNWYVQTPIYLAGRLGANSTRYNTQKLGLSGGIGVIPTYINFVESPDLWEMQELLFNPAAMIQASLNLGGSALTARFQFSLAAAKGEGDLFGPGNGFLPDRQANFRTWGLGLIYDF